MRHSFPSSYLGKAFKVTVWNARSLVLGRKLKSHMCRDLRVNALSLSGKFKISCPNLKFPPNFIFRAKIWISCQILKFLPNLKFRAKIWISRPTVNLRRRLLHLLTGFPAAKRPPRTSRWPGGRRCWCSKIGSRCGWNLEAPIYK